MSRKVSEAGPGQLALLDGAIEPQVAQPLVENPYADVKPVELPGLDGNNPWNVPVPPKELARQWDALTPEEQTERKQSAAKNAAMAREAARIAVINARAKRGAK